MATMKALPRVAWWVLLLVEQMVELSVEVKAIHSAFLMVACRVVTMADGLAEWSVFL